MPICKSVLHACRAIALIGGSTNVFLKLPTLSKPENNVSLLLTWSTMVSSRQIRVLSDWACSADSWDLHTQLVEAFQGSQSVEQLALTMTALVIYRRLLPDLSKHSDKPTKTIYLADLDAFLHGDCHGNLGRVMAQTVFALLRVLRSCADQFKGPIMLLETVLDQDPPLLHVYDRCPDQYLRRRIEGQSHETAVAELSRIKLPELRGHDDADWVNVAHPEVLAFTSMDGKYEPAVLHLPANLY